MAPGMREGSSRSSSQIERRSRNRRRPLVSRLVVVSWPAFRRPKTIVAASLGLSGRPLASGVCTRSVAKSEVARQQRLATTSSA
jgi:hypothetical protein